MNARYLFRGKRIDKNERVTGFLTKQRHTPLDPNYSAPYNLEFVIDHEEKGVMLTSFIDPDTIEQCTGVCDKGGTMIFEGDILSREIIGKTIVGEVVWVDTGFTGFMLKVVRSDSTSFYPIGRGEFDDDVGDKCNDEIIGNTHGRQEPLSVSDSDTKGSK